jgi:hypothetical protein
MLCLSAVLTLAMAASLSASVFAAQEKKAVRLDCMWVIVHQGMLMGLCRVFMWGRKIKPISFFH